MEFAEAIEVSTKRVLAFSEKSYDQPRAVGRKKLPTTVGGLLVHCADHTQRHVGQSHHDGEGRDGAAGEIGA